MEIERRRRRFVLCRRQLGYRWALGVVVMALGRREMSPRLVAGEADSTVLYQFGQASADWAEDEGGNVSFRLKSKGGSFARELQASIEKKTGVLEELSREGEIFGAIDSPEP